MRCTVHVQCVQCVVQGAGGVRQEPTEGVVESQLDQEDFPLLVNAGMCTESVQCVQCVQQCTVCTACSVCSVQFCLMQDISLDLPADRVKEEKKDQ